MMHPALAGLLHDCAAARDGTPHLILADWLEDHGQPDRAAFVRLQCRLADWVPDWKERQRLIEEQDATLEANQERWLGPLAELCNRVEFIRGLAYLAVTGQKFLTKRFQAGLTETALIAGVRFLRAWSPVRVARSDGLAAVPAVSFAGLGLREAAVATLVGSERLSRAAVLDLSDNQLERDGTDALLASVLPRTLARLDLRNNNLGAEEGERLLDAVAGDLDLVNNPLGPEVVARLAERAPPDRVMNSLGMEFVPVPAGSFLMGSPAHETGARENEKPRHPVTLTQPFRLGRFAVTQGQYWTVTGQNPSEFAGDWTRPIDNVTWDDAVAFCAALAARPEEKTAGRTYRLPTEAEWEHACRAGTTTPFHLGAPPSADFVNYDGNYNYGGAPVGPYLRRTTAVGSYPPNAFGLYDMHGNVWEWCADYYAEDTYTKKARVDPTGPRRGYDRVRRGGCWDAIGSYCRSAHRNGQPADQTNRFTGFRVVLVR